MEDVLDIEITRSGLARNADIRSVRLGVAFGGPNIYIDTRERAVNLYWWNESAEYPLDSDACDALEDYLDEITY